jgi:hypothetical protein
MHAAPLQHLPDHGLCGSSLPPGYGLNCVPQKLHIQVLTPSNCTRDLIWKWGLCSQVAIEAVLGWVAALRDHAPVGMGKFWQRYAACVMTGAEVK